MIPPGGAVGIRTLPRAKPFRSTDQIGSMLAGCGFQPRRHKLSEEPGSWATPHASTVVPGRKVCPL